MGSPASGRNFYRFQSPWIVPLHNPNGRQMKLEKYEKYHLKSGGDILPQSVPDTIHTYEYQMKNWFEEKK